MTASFGWDLGGVNLKLAQVADGKVTEVVQIPCPLTPDRSKFDRAVEEAMTHCAPQARHGVTMTGELSDVFETRAEGVAYLVALMGKTTGPATRIYSLDGFLDADEAASRWQDVASANWHATAAFAASACGDGLLIDVGTTTTDLIPFKGGKPAARGLTDGVRLTEGELIYRGVVRTPVMAIAQAAPFKGRMQGIAAERFATMADVYRLTGDLPDGADPYPAADQRGKSPEESAARLARMLGRDAAEADPIAWTALAHYLARKQLEQIEADARTLLEREGFGHEAPVIGAGCGRFLAARLATSLDRPYRDFADLIDCTPEAREMAADCAPAVAAALLVAQTETNC